ncbi:MAG: TetR/AcrR family transcriptional regulator [Chloroflexota bacterium]|nr:MAG: TetR/AcrR family transcriptional regulator [Chloroflexota bacterium]
MPRRAAHEPGTRGPEATRRRILEAAIEVFAEKGYHETAVDDIVRASDTSKGAVYFHFPNKQGIFAVLVNELTKMLAQRVERSIAREQGAVAKMDAALSTVMDIFTRHRKLSRILFVEVLGAGRSCDRKLIDIHARFAQIIRRHLDEAVADGSIPPIDTEMAAYAWFGAINEIVTRWLYAEKPQPLTTVTPELRALLLRSVGVSPEYQSHINQSPEAIDDGF